MPPKRRAAQVAKGTYDDAEPDPITSPIVPASPTPQPQAQPKKVKTKAPAAAKPTSCQSQSHRQTQHQDTPKADFDDDLPPPSSAGSGTQKLNEALAEFQKPAYSTKSDWLPKFSKAIERKRVETEERLSKSDGKRAKKNAEFTKTINDQISLILKTPGEHTASSRTGTQASSKSKTSTSDAPANATTDDPYTPHPLYQHSNAYLNLCHHTLNTYTTACKIVDEAASTTTKLGEKWQEESDQLVGILEVGRRVVERRVESLTGVSGVNAGSTDVDVDGDATMVEGGGNQAADAKMKLRDIAVLKENQLARDLLGMSVSVSVSGSEIGGTGEQKGYGNWADNVRCAESGVRRMVRGLPWDEVRA